MHIKSKGPLERHYTQTYQPKSPLPTGNRKKTQNIEIFGTPSGGPAPYWQNTATLIKDKWPPTQVEIYYIYYKMGRL